MSKLRCYFAHPYYYKDTPEKFIILKEMISRRLEVIDPFEKEEELLKEYGVKNYFEGETYELARTIWTQCLGLISSARVIVAWIPAIDESFRATKSQYHTIGTAEEIAYAYEKGKFIQIISPIHHPSFAVYACDKQYFETIENWIWHHHYIWRKYKK